MAITRTQIAKQLLANGGMSLQEAKDMAPKGEFLAYINNKEADMLRKAGGSGVMTKAGIPSFDVTFEIDLDGILKVTARDKYTNAKKYIKISNSLDISEEEIKKLREIALSMANEDVRKTIYSEKVKELKAWKNIFDDILNPEISIDDQLIIDKVENCLEKIHQSNQDPDYLITNLKIIIENQNAYAA